MCLLLLLDGFCYSIHFFRISTASASNIMVLSWCWWCCFLDYEAGDHDVGGVPLDRRERCKKTKSHRTKQNDKNIRKIIYVFNTSMNIDNN